MSELGVSSVTVLEEEGGGLLSAISVTDVGQVGAERVGIRSVVVDDEFMRPECRTLAKQPNLDDAYPAACFTNQGPVRLSVAFCHPDPTTFRCLKGGWMGPTDIPVLLSSQIAGLSPHMRSYSIHRVPILHIGLYDSKNFSQVCSSTFHMLTPFQSLRTPSQFTSPVRERRDTCLLPRPEVYVDTYAVSSRSSTVSDSPRR